MRWDKVKYASKYIVYRADSESGNYSEIAETVTNSYDDTGVAANLQTR